MFNSKREKTFHSQTLNRLTMLERLTWLIPVGFIIRDCIGTRDQLVEIFQDSPTPAVIVTFIIAELFVVAIESGFWFLVARVIFHFAKNRS